MQWIVPEADARAVRDDRYGTVFEIAAGGATGLSGLGFALVTVDAQRRSPDHYHSRTEELYHILEGRGRMYLDGEARDVFPGDTVCIPLKTVHSIENTGDTPLRFACVTVPPYDPDDDIEIGSAEQ